MENDFRYIELRVPPTRFDSWRRFMDTAPEYSVGLEVIDDLPGHRGHYVHFDHHAGVIREATMSAAMQAYIAVRQGRLMQRWLRRRCPIPVYVWNADQDVCRASFILEYHELLERFHADPLPSKHRSRTRWRCRTQTAGGSGKADGKRASSATGSLRTENARRLMTVPASVVSKRTTQAAAVPAKSSDRDQHDSEARKRPPGKQEGEASSCMLKK